MKFYQYLIICLLVVLSASEITAQNGPETNGATASPDRIMLTIPGEAATSRAVTWRTAPSVTNGIAQISEASAGPFFSENVKTVDATSANWEDGNSSAMGHKAVFENLNPETSYTYRVGDGENWSEWFQFTTSSEQADPFHFLYLGDFQNDIKEHCSRLIRQAYSHFSCAEFILMAGDLVSRSNEDYWSEFFQTGDWIYGTMPIMATPGNHEYNKENDTRVFSKQWNQIFVNPQNGPEGLENKTFYVDYQGVRFISFDSPATGFYDGAREKTEKWFHEVLSNNPNEWTVVFTHYPVYSCSQGRNNEEYRNAIKPILEKYGVDLVLQGHDHTYCRGQNLENVSADCTNPPMYMVSVSGPKMYGLNVNRWSDRTASQIQLYQDIVVVDNTMEVNVYTVTGELYDSFSLIKNIDGSNEVIVAPQFRDAKEFTEIPENALNKYTEEEKELYREKFSK